MLKNPSFGLYGQATAALLGFALGSALGIGLLLAAISPQHNADIGLFVAALSLFHSWEYFYVALFHPSELNANCELKIWLTDLFLASMLNHSLHYHAALALGITEYVVERVFFPWIKGSSLVMTVGVFITFGGQIVRSVAMFTAGEPRWWAELQGSNFHHAIRTSKEKDHQLVTGGIYKHLRHPAYFGWFWWSVGTQVLLANPLSVLAYSYASWKFFHGRIPYEGNWMGVAESSQRP